MILHLLKNDIRYARSSLIAWGGLLGLMLLMIGGLRTSLGWDQAYWGFLKFGFLVGFLIQILFQALLVVKNVQKENLQNATSYWLTRPIGRGHVLASKLLFWLLFIMLPQLVQCALIGAVFPGGWSGALYGAGTIWFAISLIGFFSVLAGSVTKDVGQAFVVVFAVPFGLVVFGHLLVKGLGRFIPIELLLYSLTSIPYLETVLVVGAFIAGLFIYWQQMHHPSKRWHHRLAYVGVLMLFLLAGKLPSVESVPKSTMSLPEGATLELSQFMFTRTDRPFPGSRSGSVDYSIQLWRDKPTGSDYGLKALVEWDGLPADWLTQTESVRTYDSEGRWLREATDGWQKSQQLEQAYGVDYLRALFPDAEIFEPIRHRGASEQLFLSPLVRVKELELPAEFTSVFATRFYSPEKIRVPLDPAAKIDLGATRLRMEGVSRQAKDLVLNFNYLGVGQLGSEIGSELKEGYFALRDPATKRVAIGRQNSRSASTAFGLLTTGHFEVSFRGLDVAADEIARLELYYVKQHLVGTYVDSVQYAIPEQE